MLDAVDFDTGNGRTRQMSKHNPPQGIPQE